MMLEYLTSAELTNEHEHLAVVAAFVGFLMVRTVDCVLVTDLAKQTAVDAFVEDAAVDSFVVVVVAAAVVKCSVKNADVAGKAAAFAEVPVASTVACIERKEMLATVFLGLPSIVDQEFEEFVLQMLGYLKRPLEVLLNHGFEISINENKKAESN